MIRRDQVLGALCAAVAVLMSGAAHAAVTVTTPQTYQTVEGIGAMSSLPTLYQKAGIFYQTRPISYEYDRFCIDLGASAVRFGFDGNCNPSSGVFDWSVLSPTVSAMKEYAKRGTTRFLISVWSPPGWMKSNGQAINGGSLLSANNDAFATLLADYCKHLKDSVGIEPYALSIQNEPAFAEPYESCVYNDASLTQLVNLTAPKLTTLGLGTKLVGPEDVTSNGGLNWSNMRSCSNLWAYAGHNNCTWSAAASYVSGSGRNLWMTEWDISPAAGGVATDFMTYGNGLMGALTNAFNWWTWFSYENNLGGYGADPANNIDTLYVPDKRYYATKHFSRFVRPGAVRIGCTVNDANVTAVAFRNPGDTFAIVMINGGGSTVPENITGSGLPSSWHVYQTTASANCAYVGTSTGTGVSLAANSITSMISGNQIPTIGTDTIPYRVAQPTPDAAPGQLNVRGDDVLDLWLNGVKIANVTAGIIKRQVAVKALPDTNIIACRVINQAWGGGLLAGMFLPSMADTLKTDGTWKMVYKNPTTDPNWINLGYDDSKWGYAKDIGPVTIWPGFASWGSDAVNLYAQNAHWILGASHTYFRKVITMGAQAGSGVYVRGNNFTYKIYVDGNLLKQGAEFSSCTGGCFTVPTSTAAISMSAGSTHCISFDITDASSDGNGVLMKAGYTRSGAAGVPMDTTWWCSDSAWAGWNTVAYTDTTNWSHPDTIAAYDAGGGVGKFIYPGHFYFRKKFTSGQATQMLAEIQKLMQRDRVVAVTYYTLQGREFTGDARKLRLSRNMLIRRTVYHSGRIEEARLLRVR
jgi:glucuronoarabinoxylan endo-1,4-beta-xylanase